MLKSFLILQLSLLTVLFGYAQKENLSKSDKAALDSMLKNDAFIELMKKNNTSALDVSVGIGNGSFSGHNRAVNATGNTNQLIITPGVIYHHKSGFGIGVTTYIANDSVSSGVYQTGIIGSYDYLGKEVSTGIAYTRFISDMNLYNTKSLYQNDIYAYIKRSRGVIQPVLSLGYDNGDYKSIDNAILKRPIRGDTLVRDSTTNKASFFALSLGVEHDFSIANAFTKDDVLEITPAFAFNAGSDYISTTHLNAAYSIIPKKLVTKRRRIVATSNKFQLQSVSASLDMNYSVGKFFLQPTLFADYYLPATTSNRLAVIYSITAGVSF